MLRTPWATITSIVPFLLVWHLLHHRVSAKSHGLHPSVLVRICRGAPPKHAQNQSTVPHLHMLHGASTKTASALRICMALWAGVTRIVPPQAQRVILVGALVRVILCFCMTTSTLLLACMDLRLDGRSLASTATACRAVHRFRNASR